METTLSSWDQNMHYGLSCTKILWSLSTARINILFMTILLALHYESSQFSCCKSHSLVRFRKKHKTLYINIYLATKQKWIADADWDNKIQRDIFNLCLHLYSTWVYFISKETIALPINFVHSLTIYYVQYPTLWWQLLATHHALWTSFLTSHTLSMDILTLLSYLPPRL